MSYCGDFSDLTVRSEGGAIPEPLHREAAESIKRDLSADGRKCTENNRDQDGRFYAITRDSSGQIDGSIDRIWLFAEKKRLSS